MKKTKLLPLLLLLAMCLGACAQTTAGGSKTPEASAIPPAAEEVTAAPAVEEVTPTREPAAPPMKELAAKYIDRSATEMIAEIGEPLEAEYVPSCLGPGEDGVLSYEGFTVYTYKEDDSEIVRIVA